MWWADAIFALILILFAANGLRKGIIMGLAGLVGLIAGVYMSIRFCDLVCDLLYMKMDWSSSLIPVVSFTIIFVLILVLMLLGGKLMEASLKSLQMDWLNRVLGALFGLLKGMFLLSLVLYLGQKATLLPPNPAPDSALGLSYLYAPLRSVSITTMPVIENIDPERWKAKVEETANTLETEVRNGAEVED